MGEVVMGEVVNKDKFEAGQKTSTFIESMAWKPGSNDRKSETGKRSRKSVIGPTFPIFRFPGPIFGFRFSVSIGPTPPIFRFPPPIFGFRFPAIGPIALGGISFENKGH